jgi:hypothetical protein
VFGFVLLCAYWVDWMGFLVGEVAIRGFGPFVLLFGTWGLGCGRWEGLSWYLRCIFERVWLACDNSNGTGRQKGRN